MKLKHRATLKQQISSVTRSWLPILQANLADLKSVLEPFIETNPFISLKESYEVENNKESFKRYYNALNSKPWTKHSIQESMEQVNIATKSLYETLYDQITSSLFPTPKSQNIAYIIIENIDENGYFQGDIKKISEQTGYSIEDIERVRLRFSKLEPIGVGAKDLKESFLFQIEELIDDEEIYLEAVKIIENLEKIETFYKDKKFQEAYSVIKKLKNPPAIDYFENSDSIIPDIIIDVKNGDIHLSLNNDYYPELILDFEGLDTQMDFVKQKIKEAKDLNDALNMRKSTLYKIGLMLVEYQYDYFFGGHIKPMKLTEIAEELDRVPSTISRAIADKHLSCNRGLIPIRKFFATAIDEDISNAQIREQVAQIIKNEPKEKPLSDIKIQRLIEERLNIKIVRRTITKYRLQLGIGSSSQRKKEYKLSS